MPGNSWDDPDEHESVLDSFGYGDTAAADPEDSWLPGDHWGQDSQFGGAHPDYAQPAPAPDVTAVPSVPVWVNVSNPAGTITVQASTGGRIQRIALAHDVARMPESQLAQQILATAKLANMKGRAVQHLLVEQMLTYQGLDPATARDYIEQQMQLPTPEQSLAAEAEARAKYLHGEV
ncbi:hypothetical protein BOO86_28535 [Mycobacterium sp. CBMA 234]|uniref:YbaB/EbfC family DNA-binding protein n=1 Tax=Mycolicibacterium sp. CBMA 234 TaxID=1918495 RepID=UPI0012DC3B43|nr:YbaB/EbfC family DNA-binding protein [Mycolicibacterium sp. CBMA 234]MUL68448.1 hypothetical protein [Mycolicibacterium sp. CBMA 234]